MTTIHLYGCYQCFPQDRYGGGHGAVHDEHVQTWQVTQDLWTVWEHPILFTNNLEINLF